MCREFHKSSDEVQVIEANISCLQCGYNLRGLQSNGKCPECAGAIEKSIRGDFLKYANPDWLRKIKTGTSVALFTILLAIILGIGRAIMIWFWPTNGIPRAVGILSPILTVSEVFLLTTREPRVSITGNSTSLRDIVRIGAVLAILGSISAIAFRDSLAPYWAGLCYAVFGIGRIVATVGILLYLSRLASRIPNKPLERNTRILMWSSGITQLIATTMGIITSSLLISCVNPNNSGFSQYIYYSGLFMCILGVTMLALWTWKFFLLLSYRKSFSNAITEAVHLSSLDHQ